MPLVQNFTQTRHFVAFDDVANTLGACFFICVSQQTEGGLLKVLGVVNGSTLCVGDVLLWINGQDVRGKV